MKSLEFSRNAAKDLRRHANMQLRVMKALRDYAANPQAHANNVTELVGSTARRMRIGDFRIIFEETDDKLIITKIAPRGDVYE